jgi:hypothetical protein
MELSYEKTLCLLYFLKAVCGMLFETNPDKGALKYMGVSRDSSDYLKDVYGGILNILIHETIYRRRFGFWIRV